MEWKNRTLVLAVAVMAGALVGGCTFVPVKPEPVALDPALQPCPSRLHDIAGSILLYCATHGKLPPDFATLKQAGAASAPPLECPDSGAAYIYNPDGLEIPGQAGRIVLYDAKAVHDGRRWGLAVIEPDGSAPLDIRVVRLPAVIPLLRTRAK